MYIQFTHEFCKATIYFKDSLINVNFIFDNENIDKNNSYVISII